ncbi:hypothetical protein Tco_1121183 [Tanacetum coccineum]|uniref:Uncharacterized protein n=1 Tax=Tanacetum coccineum TaxID=301880 RepID=A0ABQ5IZK8_9ASTR
MLTTCFIPKKGQGQTEIASFKLLEFCAAASSCRCGKAICLVVLLDQSNGGEASFRGVEFIATCSFPTNICKDIMKAQVHVSKDFCYSDTALLP